MPGESVLQEAAVGHEDLTASGNNTIILDGGVSQDLACNSAAPDEPKETALLTKASEMSIAKALYKLEACKDIPSIKLIEYDGNPLTYVEFMERFKLHIHNKPHLSDDVRMVQLKMHLVGNAKRAVGGLGSQGKMYATALKSLKEQFGQPSVIARACGAGTTVIRKEFTRALGLQGRKEKIDIAVVGGKKITQKDSRRVKLWISPLNGNESYPVEAHETDHTIINVPALDRTWLKSFDHLSDIEFLTEPVQLT
ncbi:THAP domain-containing 11 [Paramuricea clavata]|uniref:THAP domain-containing 11 n=1 Tax=Paramuricea clavata TaxID=317549 RepID=A0A6S7FN34_PARCT|nr:THAP domain-containing 11 [Paramuricea clavata]